MATAALFQVDAFAPRLFSGNPASVVVLDSWLPDEVLQAIAAENAQPETAFLVADGPATPSPAGAPFHLRWFAPAVEVDLCGHATLASAHVLFHHLGWSAPNEGAPGEAVGGTVAFDTRSGRLEVTREGDLLRLDLPALSASVPHEVDAARRELTAALGAVPREVLLGDRWLVLVDSADDVRDLRPDQAALARLEVPYVLVTAPGDFGADVVSRYFAPGAGIDEDPVTGSAHCLLAPWWAERLGTTRILARQESARGGWVDCEVVGDRVWLRGRCTDYLEGRITLPS